MKGANQILLEYTIHKITEQDIVEWAHQLLYTSDWLANDRRVIGLAELIKDSKARVWENPAKLLKELVYEYYGDYRVPSHETEVFSQQALRELCIEYLVGQKTIKDLKPCVRAINNLFESPSWLGNLVQLLRNDNRSTEDNCHKDILLMEIKERLLEL